MQVAYHHTLGPLWSLNTLRSKVSGRALEPQQWHLKPLLKHLHLQLYHFVILVFPRFCFWYRVSDWSQRYVRHKNSTNAFCVDIQVKNNQNLATHKLLGQYQNNPRIKEQRGGPISHCVCVSMHQVNVLASVWFTVSEPCTKWAFIWTAGFLVIQEV